MNSMCVFCVDKSIEIHSFQFLSIPHDTTCIILLAMSDSLNNTSLVEEDDTKNNKVVSGVTTPIEDLMADSPMTEAVEDPTAATAATTAMSVDTPSEAVSSEEETQGELEKGEASVAVEETKETEDTSADLLQDYTIVVESSTERAIRRQSLLDILELLSG
ncbi:hypothetical protein BDF19DRAFT_89261 [Syncephalis fuscata]|nr:hypothetical protein BDF19DRAFT_89261 [Syncephalis fuscata]